MTSNALTALTGLATGGPQYDLVGPTVDDDVRRIVARYGADSVKEAVKRLTTAKRGRPLVKDWPELREVLLSDAREWLDGRDPFATRSNYSIAKAFADRNPGQSYPATFKRITRKLSKRVWQTIATAMQISSDGYPHAAHIRALEALSALDNHPVWKTMLDREKMNIADYEAKHGHAPPPHLTIAEVASGARGPLSNLVGLGLKSAYST